MGDPLEIRVAGLLGSLSVITLLSSLSFTALLTSCYLHASTIYDKCHVDTK